MLHPAAAATVVSGLIASVGIAAALRARGTAPATRATDTGLRGDGADDPSPV
jgi:hypothetical protein